MNKHISGVKGPFFKKCLFVLTNTNRNLWLQNFSGNKLEPVKASTSSRLSGWRVFENVIDAAQYCVYCLLGDATPELNA